VKSREDLVMSNTDLSSTDPFSAAPFKPPAGILTEFHLLLFRLFFDEFTIQLEGAVKSGI